MHCMKIPPLFLFFLLFFMCMFSSTAQDRALDFFYMGWI